MKYFLHQIHYLSVGVLKELPVIHFWYYSAGGFKYPLVGVQDIFFLVVFWTLVAEM